MSNVDISVAVATDSGLITPIVKDVPSLSLGQISDSVRELAGKAKAGKLQLNEFQAWSHLNLAGSPEKLCKGLVCVLLLLPNRPASRKDPV